MLRVLRSFEDGALRVRSVVVAGSFTISRASVRAGVSSTVGGARFLSRGAAFRTSAVIADQRMPAAPSARSIRREFSFTRTARFSEPIPGTANDISFLAADRLQQLQGKPQQKRAAEDAVAAVMKVEDHPSRSLVERLIADEAAWRSVYDEWKKLVGNKAKLDDLLLLDLAAVESKLISAPYSLTGGAATAVGRLVERAKPALLATPLMKALHAFPRALYYGDAVPADLVPLFTPEVQAEMTKWAEKYRGIRSEDRNALVVDAVVQPLLRSLERLWGPVGFKTLLGEEFKLPFWFSTHRRREMERILQVVWRFESIGETSVNRESRVWFGGRAHGKTEFMRLSSFVCALLHKRLVVGYNEYNKNQFTPQQVLALYGPEIQVTASPVTMVTQMANKGLFPVFFADEVEHCYEKDNVEALQQFLRLADSTRSLCIATGSVASLPDMIKPLQQSTQWKHLPPLNGSKMVSEYFPPVADLKEARSLADCILPRERAPSDDQLEKACWRAAGSLGKLIEVLNNEAIAIPPFDVNVTSPLNIVVGAFSDAAELRDVPMGNAFAVPEIKITDLEEALRDFDVEHPMQAIRRLQDDCTIVQTGDNYFRLVHPIMIQQYREDKQSSGLTMELMRDARPVKRRGTAVERTLLGKWAQQHRWSVVMTSYKQLANQITKEPKMFRFRFEKGKDALVVSRPSENQLLVEMHQVKAYPSESGFKATQTSEEAAVGLRTVLPHLLQSGLGKVKMSLTYHLWWYGKGGVNAAPTQQELQAVCDADRRISLQSVVVHMPADVLSVMGPDFARYAKAVCPFLSEV